MADPRLVARRGLTALAVLTMLLTGACEDVNDTGTGPSPGEPDGEVTFALALVGAVFVKNLNEIAVEALRLIDEGRTVYADTMRTCGGDRMTVTLNSSGPNPVATVTFRGYVVGCRDAPLVVTLEGTSALTMEFLETSPGLRYLVRIPFDHCPRSPSPPLGVSFTLEPDAGGVELLVSTPGDPTTVDCSAVDEFGNPASPYGEGAEVLFELDGSRATGGLVHVTGTMNYEGENGFLVVEDMSLTYAYDETVEEGTDHFGDWPGGSLEIASFAVPNNANVAITARPTEYTFDGSGGVTFRFGDIVCEGYLPENRNPCEDR